MKVVKVIGAGLAGCEAALTLASRGIKVDLYEAKPTMRSPAHHSDMLAEVVCSNSFKSDEISTASGLLKAELEVLDCKLLSVARKTKVPAGSALAVDRQKFSALVTKMIAENPNITLKNEVVAFVDMTEPTIIATGPLTLEPLSSFLERNTGAKLHFYDAAAPIISGNSIDYTKTFTAGRYGKGDDYINCPLDKDEYYAFVSELVSAQRNIAKEFEKSEIFESCMPIEVMASRGIDTLRFGPLKPVGMTDSNTGKRPFAVVQLRREDEDGNMFNIVGFQTNLLFNEQRRVFGLIPALGGAEFLRYGVMHRNTYIDAPKVIDRHFKLKSSDAVFLAGQLSGVEGYVESIASGLIAALNMDKLLKGEDLLELPRECMLGALTNYLERNNDNFQPMNANFGLLPNMDIRDKARRKIELSIRAIDKLKNIKNI